MCKRILTIATITLFLYCSGCSTDPNEKANVLYIGVSQYAKSMKTETVSYSKSFEFYKKALIDIELILSKYPSSDIAVRLSSGETLVGGFTLDQFRELETSFIEITEAEQNPFLSAICVSGGIRDYYEKAYTLSAIAVHFAEVGQNNSANKLLSQALDAAKMVGNSSDKDSALRDVSVGYAKIGDFAQALQIVERIKRARDKYEAMIKIAAEYIEIGQRKKAVQCLSQAIEAAIMIEEKFSKNFALNEIAIEYSNAEYFQLALEMAEKIKREDGKGFVLQYIARKYADAGFLTEALETAEKIKEANAKSLILSEIATVYAKVGQKEKAFQLLSQALELAMIVGDQYRAGVLADVAVKYDTLGQREKTNQLLSQALESAMKINDKGQSMILSSIAAKYYGLGQKEKATLLLSQALEAAMKIKDVIYKDWSLDVVAYGYAEIGNFPKTLEAVEKKVDNSDKGSCLVTIAGKYAEHGQKENAAKLLSLALEGVAKIENKGSKARLLANIAAEAVKERHVLIQKDIAQLQAIAHASHSMKEFFARELNN